MITLEVPEPAIIDVSSSDPATPNRKLTGTIHARENKTLMVVTGEEIAVSACIKVQSKHLLTLGQVVRCVHGPEAKWTVHVGIERSMLIV